MPEKSPETYSVITYLWVVGLASLGGVAAFIRKVRDGHARAWNFVELTGEIVISAFAGLMTFYMCEWAGFNQLATAMFVGIAGHMGSKCIFLLEHYVSDKINPNTSQQTGAGNAEQG